MSLILKSRPANLAIPPLYGTVVACSVAGRAAPASTIYALYILFLFQGFLRHTADTRRPKVGLLGLYAPYAAEL
jgi:hypothetical protein